MSIETGGPAFSNYVEWRLSADDGMTLRDWFAGQALAGMTGDPERSGPFEAYAKDAYEYADAMLKARGES